MVRQTNKEKLSITLDFDVFKLVIEAAEKDDRSVSSMINTILRNALKKED